MTKRTSEIDSAIGAKLRTLRTERSLSQQSLADLLGITFQQVQKYEKGTNRISAASLYRISRQWNLPLAVFFEDIGETGDTDSVGEAELV